MTRRNSSEKRARTIVCPVCAAAIGKPCVYTETAHTADRSRRVDTTPAAVSMQSTPNPSRPLRSASSWIVRAPT